VTWNLTSKLLVLQAKQFEKHCCVPLGVNQKIWIDAYKYIDFYPIFLFFFHTRQYSDC